MISPLRDDSRNDTRIGEQPALRTSSGRIWLIMGAITAAACVGILVVLSTRQPTIGFIGAGVVVALYVAMIVVTLVIRNVRAKLVALAILLVAMGVTALAFVLVILSAEWSAIL